MSWSFEHTGTKDGVAKATAETLDKLAAGYAGKEEGADLLAVKERALALIAALDLDDYGNAVNVKGSGSHSTSSKGIFSANLSLSVTRTSLKL